MKTHRRFVRSVALTSLALTGWLTVTPAVAASTAARSLASTDADRARIVEAYRNLPLSFIRNDGQTDPTVAFFERGRGHATFFTNHGVHLSLSKSSWSSARSAERTVVTLAPVGANGHPTIVGEGLQPGRTHYLVGKDHAAWTRNVPSYAAVVYRDVYPGIDLKFYGNQRQLEYDVVVHPGADPSRVRMAYFGISGLRVTDAGDLEIAVRGGTLLQKKPVIFQYVEGKRVSVPGRFVVDPITDKASPVFSYGFQVASYDRERPLVIDPTLVYSTYLGGADEDASLGVAVDATGNVYLTGSTASASFPTVGGVQGAIAGGADAFVTKLNAAGSSVVYSTYLGGSGTDTGTSIAVDGAGNAYVAGETQSTNFPVIGAIQATHGGGGTDAFVVKLNAAGNALAYGTYLGGSGADRANGVAVDAAGVASVVGQTASTNFPTANAAQTASGGAGDAFVSKLNATGSAWVYSTYVGGSGADSGNGIAVDSAGNASITGQTASANFPTTATSLQPAFGGGSSDAFVAQLDPLGAAVTYATYLGGAGADSGAAIAVDAYGTAYAIGSTGSSDFPTMNPIQTALAGSSDAFVSSLDSSGSVLISSTYWGGGSADQGTGIATDAVGNVYVGGQTSSSDFPTSNAVQGALQGASDGFVTMFDAVGAVGYSTYLGGALGETAHAIAVDRSGNVVVSGSTDSTNFPAASPIQGTRGGLHDAFVTTISPMNRLLVAKTGTGAGTVTSYPAGISCGAACSALMAPGAPVSLTAIPTAPAVFTGWSGDCTGTGSCDIAMDGAKSVVATFATPAPVIFKGYPSSVVYGLSPSGSMILYGANFVEGARVTIGGLTGTAVRSGSLATAAMPFVYINSGQINFYWPNTGLAAGPVSVTVTNPAAAGGLSGSLANAFTVAGPQPVVTGVIGAPVYGVSADQAITITGANFVVGARITVGGITGTTVAGSLAQPATPFVRVSSTRLQFYWRNTSLAAGTYAVQVTSPAAGGGLSATRPNAFPVAAPRPVVTSVPTGAVYGVSPNGAVTITGSNFAVGARITVGGITGTTVAGGVASVLQPFVRISSTRLQFYWTNTSLPAGSYAVQVTSPARGGGLSGILANGFTVGAPQPVITSVTPGGGRFGLTRPSGYPIKITGANFVVGARITVGGITGTTVAGGVASTVQPFVRVSTKEVQFYWSSTSLPAGTYSVQVTSPAAGGGLSASLANAFTVTLP
ncbi:MAG: beta strand repeat-containing protein [Nitrospirota bacterium]